MGLYSVALKGRKISIKTFLGILSFVSIILFLQGQGAAQAAQFKTAFIRASDGKVYQIHYQKPFSIEDFLISNIDGDPVPRNIAAELYLAARFLNEPPPVFKEGELKSWVDDEYRHTAKWKNYHSVATYVGSISAGFLTGQLTSGISVTTSIAQSTAGKHAIQGLTSITTLVGEQAVLAQAYAITDVFVERTVSKRRIVDNLLSSANAGTEINIDDLKSAYNALLQSVKYGLWVGWMVEEYLTLPSRWERLWTFAKTIFPLSSLGQFFASAGQNIEDLRTLQRIFEESDRQIAAEASATVDSIYDEDTIASHVAKLEDDGFYENKGPRLIAAIRHQMLEVGDPPTILDLSDYFRDPNGDTLTYEVWADDYDEIEGERNGSVIEITPIARGSTTVRIIATDPSSGLEAAEIFFVFVSDPPRQVQNQKPEPVDSVPDQTVEIGESLSPLDISGYFHDPDGDTLTYTAWSIPTSIVRVEREGSEITITPLSEGSTTVTVRATDPDGLRTFQRISVTVTAPQTPQEQPPVVVPPIPPSQGFEKGDAVIVQNTAPSVLNIRGGAGLAWGKKGQVSDGATGTIIDGPVSKNGFIWWKIKWNDSNKVVWTNRPASNEAWCVEVIDGTEYLALRPSDPVVQSFDLAIQSITVNKTNLSPDEYFTLNITIHNNGPGRSAASDLSYYHSSVQGRMPTDRPQLQGTVSLDPIAPNKSTIKSIRLQAPSTSRTYYYGAWLTVHGGDTDINNDVATEVGVIVTDSPNQISSNSPDLVIESISANKVLLAPSENFRLDAIVRNQGKVDAPSTYLRYYRSSDPTISTTDTEVGDDRMTTPDAGQTYDKWERLRAPDTPGVYYYGACVDSVTGEIDTLNNCSEAIEITVRVPNMRGLPNIDVPDADVPDTPDVPGVDVPDADVPDTPDVPGVDVPDTPDVPDTDVPDADVPDTDVPDTPDVPDTDVPDTPDVPDADVPDTDVPDTPDVPDADVPDTDVPDTPDLPTPSVPGFSLSSTPDIPAVPIPSFTVPGIDNRNQQTDTPPTSQGICDRTQQVLNEILAEMDVNDCADLESGDLGSITSLLLSDAGITTLKENDFEGLSGLDDLNLRGNSLSSLSVGVLDGMSALKTLDLGENSLHSLTVDVFDELSSLRWLDLKDNGLRSLPVGVFNGLSALRNLDLQNNSLRSLPVGIFDGLDALETLDLEDNQFTTLPNGIFDDILDTLGSSSSDLGVDDSLKTTFGFSTTAQDAAEGDTVRVTVNLGRSLPVAVRVPYTVGGTATTADYTNLQTPTELLFLAGETSKQIVFTLLEDADTTAETISLTLAELRDVKLRKSDGSGVDAKLSAYTVLNEPQQTIHTVTVTTGGGGVSRPMYWTAGDNKIRRSKLDGTLVQVLFDGGNLRGIALDVSGGKMYWVDTGIDAIRRANLDGSGVVNLVTDLGSPTGIALDISGGKMYWLDSSTDKIQRANLTGSAIEDLVTGLSSPKEIALDVSGGKMYWTDSGTDKIQRANLNGTSVQDLVTGLSSPRGIALDVSGGKMYWLDSSTNKIQRANLDGTNIEDLVTSIDIGADGIALDISGGKMYWADNQENKIQRANLDGSQIEQLYTGGYPVSIALAIGAGTVNAAPSAMSTNAALILPSETALLTNYPNPFNPETWIPYRLSKPAEVRLHIYAVDGRLIRALALGHQPAGVCYSKSRAAYWDGRNELGEPVASGIYFYTLTAGEFTATRKMLIRK